MGLLTDLQHSARSFARTPGVAVGLLLTVALGIGSNVVVHGFIRGLVVRHSPLTNAGRIVSLFELDAQGGTALISYEDFNALRARTDTFEWAGAAREFRATVDFSNRRDILSISAVSRELVGPLSLTMAEGAVISHRLWVEEFNRSDVGDVRMRIDGVETALDGVAPEWLDGLYLGRPIDVWIPFREEALQGGDRISRSLWVLARLRQGLSIPPTQNQIRAVPYTKIPPEMTNGMAQVEGVLSFSTAIVFVIACANVASFLTGRSAARAHQTSLRVALGAGRGQLTRQLLADSVLVTVAGGTLGTVLAVWTSRVVPLLFFESDAEQLAFAPDFWSIAASSTLCAGIMVVCGLLPLWEIRVDRPADVLRRQRSTTSKTMRVVRSALVSGQMACCCVLIVSTGVLVDGLRRGFLTGTGMRVGQPVFATVQASPGLVSRYLHLQYFREVEGAVRKLGGVGTASWAQSLPGNRPSWQSLRIELPPSRWQDVTLDTAVFTVDAPPLFTLPVRAGRMFGGGDTAGTCRVGIVNEQAAKELFDGDAVGRAILDSLGQRVDIIGVVTSVTPDRAKSLHTRPTIYFYGDQDGRPYEVRREQFRVPVILEDVQAVLDSNVVSPGYFDAMGLSLKAGQHIANLKMPRDCRVGLVNREAAELHFGGNAIGASVIDERGRRTEIVGVLQAAPLGTFQRRVEPTIYFGMSWDSPGLMRLILQAGEPTPAVLDAIERQIESVPGRGAEPAVAKTLETHFSQTALAPLRIATLIVGASSAMALVLSVLGLHGALTAVARQRGRELAVRVALGAQRRHVIAQVLSEGARLAAAGAVAGVLGSLLQLGYLAQYGGSAPRLWVWGAALLVLAAAVGVAGVLPARRALLEDPLQIMRDE
jgi:ABC-type lipoprotein release transport system permease subunit